MKSNGNRKKDTLMEASLKRIRYCAVEPLTAILRDSESRLQSCAIEALVIVGNPAVESVIGTLGDQSVEVRVFALRILKKIGDVRAVQPIKELLKVERNGICRNEAKAALDYFNGTVAPIPRTPQRSPE
jgi:HEAT repeat protein